MSENSKVKVLGVGSPILDILVHVEDLFIESLDGDKGGMELVSSQTMNQILTRIDQQKLLETGGSAANTIFGLNRLGVNTALLGKVGDDEDGRFYTSSYEKLGGDSSKLKSVEGVYTGRCLSMVTPDSERTMRTDLGAAATFSVDDIKSSDFENASHVHLEGYILFCEDNFRKVLEEAKRAGCTVSLDLASFEVVKAAKSFLPELLSKYVDIVFANKDEAREFCGDDSFEVAADKLSEYCDTVCIKLGKDGAFIKNGDKTARVEADIVEAVDTTGAGDLWQTGFLYGFLNGYSLNECGRFGSIIASEVVQVLGASIPEESWLDIINRMKN